MNDTAKGSTELNTDGKAVAPQDRGEGLGTVVQTTAAARRHSAGRGTKNNSAATSESRRAAAELEKLIGPAAAGDRAAVTEILKIVYPLVRRYCAARMGGAGHLHVTADDVAQEICMATVQAIPRYRDQGKSFLAFVYGISANKVADAFRRAQLHPAYPVAEFPDEPMNEAGPEERAMQSETRAATRELMKVLAPTHREVLVMRIVLGWTAAQTAEAIGTSPGVVRVMQHRALNKLRAELRAAS